MHCNELASTIDDYMDRGLAVHDVAALEQHLNTCSNCTAAYEERRSLRACLAALPVEGPNEDFFERALQQATAEAALAAKQSPRVVRPWFVRTGGAIAAAFAMVMITGLVMQTSLFGSDSAIPEITIAMHEVTPVNLEFTSAVALEGARISLQLPEGVELAGFTGRKQLSWRTDLREGNNLLQLPLLGYLASSDRLVAELRHPNGTKTFALQITVN